MDDLIDLPADALEEHQYPGALEGAARVEPAQAPMNMRMTSRNRENSGHRSKSTLEKPVVEMMVATWKAAARMVSHRLVK